MIPKDWVADVIVDVFRSDEAEPSEVREAIETHCPFKKDVAYMPVPRCEDCRLWKRHNLATKFGTARTGDCRVNGRIASINATRFDFGCVAWEAK